MTATPIEILGTTSAQLRALAAELLPCGAGAAAAIHRAAVERGAFAPESAGLGATASAFWRRAFACTLPEVTARAVEPTARGASIEKLRLRCADDSAIECVRLPIGTLREALCVSTQVGCRMACRFCETARMGLRRNLTAAEIVAQVAVARRLGHDPRSIVFMGMGEPLDNCDALLAALAVLADEGGFAFAHDRLTVCTVGRVDGIRRLAALGWKRLGLAVSLNAADDDARARLMPLAAQTKLAELQRALVDYRQRANFRLGVHYCLMPGINDTRADAHGVAAFCRPLGRSLVHVIAYNPGTVPLTRAPTDAEVARFVGWLREDGLAVRRRVTKGRSVMAACGQLGIARAERGANHHAPSA